MNELRTSSSDLYSDGDFVELERTFQEISTDTAVDAGIDLSLLGLGLWQLHWKDLVQQQRFIILSEAGSGKTVEIRNTARKLRQEGKQAFFLRLEYVSVDFEISFEIGEYREFELWLKSNEHGWLFLDSVDEARLRHPKDFEHAIRKLEERIITAQDRVNICITGRTAAWRPHTDLALCNDHLRRSPILSLAPQPTSTDATQDESLTHQDQVNGAKNNGFKVYTLEDLNSKQVAIFAEARGIFDSQPFLDAIERADAWSFTSRPQDLLELTEYWIKNGQLGSKLDLLRNSINRRLLESDQDRSESRPLSDERTRQGVLLLAAATTLVQEPTIRIPDGARNTEGIPAKSLLTSWDDRDVSTLLSRPIFDEAIYGAVRFHHRSVREYLTAEWFKKLLERDTSRRIIESLFFPTQYDLEVVEPTLRPLLPWLILEDQRIRHHALRLAPEVMLEGGDPSKLPVELRREVLGKLCTQMAEGAAYYSANQRVAIQQFANVDLTDDVRALLTRYQNVERLATFLLHLIWLGELKGTISEVKWIALNTDASYYTRMEAFAALNEIGSEMDKEEVRQSFLIEGGRLNREWLSKLVDGLPPSERLLGWLIACLSKTEPIESHSVDHLQYALVEFVKKSDLDFLPSIVSKLASLLNRRPYLDAEYCRVSHRFSWLVIPAALAVEQLIVAKHSAALDPSSLSVLDKVSKMHFHGANLTAIESVDFSRIIPTWEQLNRKLFWYQVDRERISPKVERLTEYRQVWRLHPQWRFEDSDFEYVVKQISGRRSLDNKLVAMSLAFEIYTRAGQPRKWKAQLVKAAAADSHLTSSLSRYLTPRKQSDEVLRWEERKAEYDRRALAKREMDEKLYSLERQSIIENLNEIQDSQSKNPGSINDHLFYLFRQLLAKNRDNGRWTDYNWKSLEPEYNQQVANFYRDSTVAFWRHYKPKLRSEGYPFNKTPYAVILGLVGIEIEATETTDWAKKLTKEDVELACRYASHELNGFPAWFPNLFEKHPREVDEFLVQEIESELRLGEKRSDIHGILSDVRYTGQWAWNQIAPKLYEFLWHKEPKNLANLDRLLKIIQGSSMSDDEISDLASRKCQYQRNVEHLSRWYAVWMGVSPDSAIISLERRLQRIGDSNIQTNFAMMFVTHLVGNYRGDDSLARSEFKRPKPLSNLYLLMNDYIRPDEDVVRSGMNMYTPGLRDDAQEARGRLLHLLMEIPGKDAFVALRELADRQQLKSLKNWLQSKAIQKAEQDSKLTPWLPTDVADFTEQYERTPRNHRELAELARLRLLDLRDDLEHGDSSIAGLLQRIDQETEIRKFIGDVLRDKANGRYSVAQEEEFADSKRADIRFHGAGFDGPVPVELKLADNWPGPRLFERLENQLCLDYLRDPLSNRGIFALVYRGDKQSWQLPDSTERVDFAGLIKALSSFWKAISPRIINVEDIQVIGIDLTRRSK